MRILAWFILSTATAAMAGAYAYAVGGSHGEVWAWISAASVVALLVAESTLAGDGVSCPPGIRWPALFLAMLSLLSLEAGFLASTASDAKTARQDAARNLELRAARTTAEPAAAIRARLDAHEARHRVIRASWCGSTSTEARTACDTWTTLRADLATAIAGEAMPVASGGPVGEADARADLLSRVLGGAADRWADAATLLLAAALSFTRLACASAVFGGHVTEAIVVNIPEPAPPVVVPPINPVPLPVPPPAHVEAVTTEVGPLPVEPVNTAPEADLQPVTAAVDSPVADAPPAVLVTRAARRVLQLVAKAAEVQPDGLAVVPPGRMSPASLAERTGLPRRQVADSLDMLQRAGLLQVTRHGRAGTGFAVTRAAG